MAFVTASAKHVMLFDSTKNIFTLINAIKKQG